MQIQYSGKQFPVVYLWCAYALHIGFPSYRKLFSCLTMTIPRMPNEYGRLGGYFFFFSTIAAVVLVPVSDRLVLSMQTN